MKRKTYLPVFIAASILLLAAFPAAGQNTLTHIGKIEIRSGTLSSQLVLKSDARLAVHSAFYAPQDSRILIIDIDKAITSEVPPSVVSGNPLIENLQIEKNGDSGLRVRLSLKERVPYRLLCRDDATVIELSHIRRTGQDYIIDPETRTKLAGRNGNTSVLSGLEISSTPDRIIFRAGLGEEAISQVFALDNPSRLVVDLFGTMFPKSSAVYPVSKMGIDKVRIGQFQASGPAPITRMVFDLQGEPGGYTMDTENGELIISFFNAPSAIVEPAIRKVMSAETVPAANTPAPVVRPAAAKPAPPATPPREVREVAAQEKPRQEDKFKPRIISGEEEQYSGEILSLKFKDADLRDVVLFLADFAGLNVVFDPDVRGTVTCDLQDVPWDQALDIVLRFNRMGKTIEGNVLRIAPINILTSEDNEQRKLKESKEMAGPLHVKTITLSYSKAKDVASLLKTKISSRGELVVDERTNTLIISEVKEKLDLLEKLIIVLDTPTPQVSIEARIVEATTTFIRNLGIQWGYQGIVDPSYGNQTSLSFPNKILADGAMIPQGTVTKGIGGPLGGYAVNLPAASFNTALGFSFANVLDTFRLDVALTALESAGNGRIISCPKVTTQNNMPAEIIQGRQIPVQTVANFTVTTRYVNAALELKATPQITAEGTIIMTLDIQNNAADFSQLVNGIPPITMQSAKTTVMIPDGGTTVIGGIYRTEDSVTKDRTPFLHQIPILGNLFRASARTKQSRELLIFITPRIIK